MSNRAKLLISLLFIAAIVICAALTRFYFDVTKNTGNSTSDDQVDAVIKSVGTYRIFRSTSGYYGLLDGDDTVVIEPDWLEILDVTQDIVIVSQRLHGAALIGGIDFEENAVLPFVFRSMEEVGGFRVGTVDADNTCIVYDENYVPVFPMSHDAVSYDNGVMQLLTQGDSFAYYVAEETPVLRRAEMVCAVGGKELRWRVAGQKLLASLDERSILRMNSCMERYLDMLISNDFSQLYEISGAEFVASLARPGSFEDPVIDEIGNFAFSHAEKAQEPYMVSFTISYHTAEQEAGQQVRMQLGFRYNADKNLILTSAAMEYQSSQPADEQAEMG